VTRAWLLDPTTHGEGAASAPFAVRAIDSPARAPAAGEVVIAIEAATVSPVDLAVARARGGRAEATDDTLVAGGSAVGRVIAAGAEHEALLGMRAIVGPHLPCGDCDLCRRGGAVVCPNGSRLGVTERGVLAERVTLPSRWVVAFGGDLDVPGPAAAVLGGDAALAYAMYARAGVGPRDATVVLGDGPVARLLIEILIAKNATPVVVARSNAPDGWATWAASRGSHVAHVDADAPDAESRAAALAAIRSAGNAGKPWKLFETTGEAARQTRALAIAGARATVVLAAPGATGMPTESVDLGDALDEDSTVIGVAGAHPDLLVDVAAMAVKGELDVASACEAVAVEDLAAALARRAGVRLATSLVATISATR
jgi:threonine dehydrogenase-like Zn-dependent dehydrogenase